MSDSHDAETSSAESARGSALDPHLGRMFELLGDAVGVHSAGRLVALNPACLTLFRYRDGAHLIGKSLLVLLAPSEHARIAEYVRRRTTDDPPPTTYVTRGVRGDGTEFDLEVALTTFSHDGTSFAIVRMRDVTTEQETARALRDSNEKFRLLTSQALVGIYMLQDDHVIFVNAGVSEITGFTVEEMTNWRFSDFARSIHPDDLAFVSEQARRKQLGEPGATVQYGYRLLHRDGTVRFVEQYSKSVTYGDGLALLGVIVDVTARTHAERSAAKLEDALRQSQKMEAVGRLAGGIAHDFNNLLTAILGNLELAKIAGTSHDEVRQSIDDAIAAAERAGVLTRGLLAFSRNQVLDAQPLEVASLVRVAERMLARLLGENFVLTVKMAETPATIVGDEAHLVQVLVNLAINARDAMPDGGRVDLEVELLTLDADAAKKLGLATGPFVRIDVRDTGHGISPELLGRIFEPFFTTKPVGQGTGLGLAVAFGVVRQLGGAITAASEPGRGACFSVYLPQVSPAPDAPGAPSEPELAPGGGATVLLVEDEPAVRRVAQRTLEHAGYRVLACEDAAAALARIARHDGPIDLLFTDIRMPGMNGLELARRLLDERPLLPVLFTTGYTQEALDDRLQASASMLAKPYTPASLLEAVDREIRRRR